MAWVHPLTGGDEEAAASAASAASAAVTLLPLSLWRRMNPVVGYSREKNPDRGRCVSSFYGDPTLDNLNGVNYVTR